ncbi:MAG TPA: nucleoside monophosphate kinase [Candidatus Paceibacterota bacterium]|nr:nucleoside monophosphate kinase [Candidatus Paceibacterota bacterium]
MKSRNIIFLGRSGSGKGTQAELLMKKFALVNIDTGDILRRLAKKNDKFGKRVLETISHGKLVPIWLVIYCWLDQLLKIPSKKGIIMEGSPRQLEEAKTLEEVFSWLGREDFKVVYLQTSAKEVTQRLLIRRICSKCGKEFSLNFTPNLKNCSHCGGKLIRRKDDNPKAIKNRMLFFQKKILPVINYFRKKKMVIEINGEGSVQEIYKRILKKLL